MPPSDRPWPHAARELFRPSPKPPPTEKSQLSWKLDRCPSIQKESYRADGCLPATEECPSLDQPQPATCLPAKPTAARHRVARPAPCECQFHGSGQQLCTTSLHTTQRMRATTPALRRKLRASPVQSYFRLPD